MGRQPGEQGRNAACTSAGRASEEMLFGPREQAEETDALGTQDTQSGPEPGDEGMAIASRHLETPGQRQEAGRMVSLTAPTGPRPWLFPGRPWP